MPLKWINQSYNFQITTKMEQALIFLMTLPFVETELFIDEFSVSGLWRPQDYNGFAEISMCATKYHSHSQRNSINWNAIIHKYQMTHLIPISQQNFEILSYSLKNPKRTQMLLQKFLCLEITICSLLVDRATCRTSQTKTIVYHHQHRFQYHTTLSSPHFLPYFQYSTHYSNLHHSPILHTGYKMVIIQSKERKSRFY